MAFLTKIFLLVFIPICCLLFDHSGDSIRKDTLKGKKYEQLEFNYENARAYFFSKLRYPPEAFKNNIEGTVIVHFTILENGTVDSIRIVKAVHPLLDKEALRLIEEMPLWKPIYNKGQAIQVSHEIPIIFEIKEEAINNKTDTLNYDRNY